MCGIVATTGHKDAAPLILDALKRLEYRGYDSSGIAFVKDEGVVRQRAQGKLSTLESLLATSPLSGRTGLGHNRWATHGPPTEHNAHPHVVDTVAVVHNGIIENYRELKSQLAHKKFESDTDTEIIAHLVNEELQQGREPLEAVWAVLPRLRGAYAIALLFGGYEMVVGAFMGSPLVVGKGEGTWLASDEIALSPFVEKVSYPEEGDCVVLRPDGIEMFSSYRRSVLRPFKSVSASLAAVGKGGYQHFMAKEIFEQPEVLGHTLGRYLDAHTETVSASPLRDRFGEVESLLALACGSSLYTGLVGGYWFESLAGLPCRVEVASEFRYRGVAFGSKSLALCISQSGETADTLAALGYCAQEKICTAAIVNAPNSRMSRLADVTLPLWAGAEIGVASTKSFLCQLALLACLVLEAARVRGSMTEQEEQEFVRALISVPRHAAAILQKTKGLQKIAKKHLAKASSVLYLGRGALFPIALEGALKLKELSYIHAEGFAAGELKHGPIALIDESVPVVAVAPSGALFEKILSNLEEIHARGARILLLTDEEGADSGASLAQETVVLPTVEEFVKPILFTIPLQLLAYYTALAKGTDVDQPRNLAKSVTVE